MINLEPDDSGRNRLYLDEDLPTGARQVALSEDGSVSYTDKAGKLQIIRRKELIAADVNEVILWSNDTERPIYWSTPPQDTRFNGEFRPAPRFDDLVPITATRVVIDPELGEVRFFDPLDGPDRRYFEDNLDYDPRNPTISFNSYRN